MTSINAFLDIPSQSTFPLTYLPGSILSVYPDLGSTISFSMFNTSPKGPVNVVSLNLLKAAPKKLPKLLLRRFIPPLRPFPIRNLLPAITAFFKGLADTIPPAPFTPPNISSIEEIISV